MMILTSIPKGRVAARTLALAAALSLLAVLGGCLGGHTAGQPTIFDLGAAAMPARADTARMGVTADPVVLSVAGSPMQNDNGMIWRLADSPQPRSYATVRWAASPVQLVTEQLTQRLSRDVPVLADSPANDTAQVRVTLTQFEQVFAENGSSSEGRVTLRAILLKQRRVVDQTLITRAVSAPSQDAEGGVVALREATAQAGDALATWVVQRR